MNTKQLWAILLILVSVTGCSRSPSRSAPPTHGTSLLVTMDGSKLGTNGVESIKEALARRLDRFGERGFLVIAQSNAIRISVAVTEPDKIAALTNAFSMPGKIEFRSVHKESDELIAAGKGAPGYERLAEKRKNRGGGPAVNVPRLVKIEPAISGAHLASASVYKDPMTKAPVIMIRFDPGGTAALKNATTDNVDQFLAIVIDGKLVTAPRILEPITGGVASIQGDFTLAEALNLANALETPLALPVTVTVEKVF